MQHNNDIVEQLRDRACPSGQPHTGDDPKADHGHTDCWLHHLAADEIERLRALINDWADAEDEADMIRGFDLFTAYKSLRKAVGR
jgi:hypothetical protein